MKYPFKMKYSICIFLFKNDKFQFLDCLCNHISFVQGNFTCLYISNISVTPLDVVKIRLQTQQKAMLSNKCFLYCNGLMDHLCPCTNGKMPEWMRRNGKFNGTVVCDNYIIMIQFKMFIFIIY